MASHDEAIPVQPVRFYDPRDLMDFRPIDKSQLDATEPEEIEEPVDDDVDPKDSSALAPAASSDFGQGIPSDLVPNPDSPTGSQVPPEATADAGKDSSQAKDQSPGPPTS